MCDNENFMVALFLGTLFVGILLFCHLAFFLGAFVSTGTGQYTGTVVETQNHGLFFKTYAVQLKTSGFTTKFEDFCVLDSKIYDQLSNIPRDKNLTVTYEKKLSTPSWKCAMEDSSDIITSIKIEEEK